MRSIATRLAALSCATLIGIGGEVAAHGEANHARPGAAVKEQKPWGIAGERKAARRTVVFRMSDDMRFSPARLDVTVGETLRLVIFNDGRLMHEFVIGTKDELDAHAELMAKFPDMEHDEPYMAHVAPGKSGEIVWTFNRTGSFAFACLIAGHYQAGMTGPITVRSAPAPARRTP